MHLELTTYYSFKVASLVTGIAVDFSYALNLGPLRGLLINLFEGKVGLTGVDRIYPLKPKNPI
ncbi:hypothetical protein [Algoriphagus boritolerans]|uniref:Uncharacterized protein n=1 Tax=Algoriphagus boritolerans DSM 17298 = JCM 18970 TaxID=1120964 RepID=A0A1H5XVA9_9BACT|nr:hypothetical protein [Algoriphagus boritolerans]SEG15598.1 hypothetical protein SAMN03080598_02698 [Algoriphagus boritolerans DSM 17298 = JCM 18970]